MTTRLLLVHPGHSFSTADLYTGLKAGLEQCGVEIVPYLLESRLGVAEAWLKFVDRRSKLRKGEIWQQRTKDERWAAMLAKAGEEIVTRALRHRVDGILIVTAMCVHPDALMLCRRAHIPVGIVLSESPYDDGPQARVAGLVDVCWTNERTSLAALRAANPATHSLPAAYNPAVHTAEPQPGDEDVPAHDVVFVGTIFPERVALLEQVDWSGIDLGLYGNALSVTTRHPLYPYLRGGLTDNRYAAALYRRAKVGLNLYRAHPTAESLNPRAYELAACGCYQVSEPRAEAAELFGVACARFRDPAELERVLRASLDEAAYHATVTDARGLPGVRRDTLPSAAVYRERMAERAWRAAAPHTFEARAAQIMEQFAPVLDRQYAAACG